MNEIVGQEKSVKQVKDFFAKFKKGRGLFLYGPPGVGKTTSVYAYAKENNYEVLELNASDGRNQKILKEFLSNSTLQASLFGRKKIILLDEVDGLSGMKDRGAPTVISAFIKSSTFPIVLTGNNVFDKKFSKLKKETKVVEFEKVLPSDIRTIIENACTRAGITCDEKLVKKISRSCSGDARGALNDIFASSIIDGCNDDDIAARKQTDTMENALIRVLKSTNPDIALGAYDDVNEDLDKIFLWVDENVPREYKKIDDLERAYNEIAEADKFFGRIRKWQYYRFYVYCYQLLSAGIALAKDEKYTVPPNYRQSMRPLTYWKANMTYGKRNSIAEKIAAKTNSSVRRAKQDTMPLLMQAIVKDTSLQKEFEITKDELMWLRNRLLSKG